MNLFTTVPRYSRDTGERVGRDLHVYRYVCDYCGRILDPQEEPLPDVSYAINEDPNRERVFVGESLVVEDVEYDLWAVYERHPHFFYCQCEGEIAGCDQRLTIEWLASLLGQGTEFKILEQAVGEFVTGENLGDSFSLRHTTLAGAMCVARHRVIRKMLREGCSPAQLALEVKE